MDCEVTRRYKHSLDRGRGGKTHRHTWSSSGSRPKHGQANLVGLAAASEIPLRAIPAAKAVTINCTVACPYDGERINKPAAPPSMILTSPPGRTHQCCCS